jgi:hypothetical protein
LGRFCGWADDDFFTGAFNDVEEVAAPADRVVQQLLEALAGKVLSSAPSVW